MDLQGKKVLVAGTGISGIGAAQLLLKIGAVPILYDGNEALSVREIKEKLPEEADIPIILGELKKEQLSGISIMVVSPGIPVDVQAVALAREQGIIIWGEIELAYQLSKGALCAITGTNGKTTTTALVGEILKSWYESVYVVGNIGIPYTSVALETKEDSVTVAEISSFQLETVWEFAPKVTAILNITPDHLNRHKTMENYIAVKEGITKNQKPADTCVLNYEDAVLRQFGEGLKTRVVYFSSKRKLPIEICPIGIYLEGEEIVYRTKQELFPVLKVSELLLAGIHNVENVMAAVAVSYAMGVPMDTIRTAVKKFRAVEHRLEFVRNREDVFYYNDSKGTNPDASIQAIRAMVRPTLLIGGGYDKQSEFDAYVDAFDGKVKCLVLFGATRDKIAAAARKAGFGQIIMVDSLKEAVDVCAGRAAPGDAVLLSPACASWDMFQSYEERGRLFKEYVNSL